MFKKGLIKEYAPLFSLLVRIFDLLTVVGGGILAYYIRFGSLDLGGSYQIALIIGALLAAVVLPAFKIYGSWRGKGLFRQLWIMTLAWFVTVVGLAILAFSLKTGAEYSRYWAGIWAISVWVLLIFSRVGLRIIFGYFRRKGWNSRNIVIIGAGHLGAHVAQQIADAEWTGYNLKGFWDDSPNLQGKEVEGVIVYSIESGIDGLLSGRLKIDEIWIALPLRAELRMQEVLNLLRHSTVSVRLVPDIFGFRLLNHSMTEVAGIPVMDISASPMIGMNRLIKAIEDRVLGGLIILIVSPLMLIIAIAIKITSRGPVLFKQMRHGWDGKPVKVYKFRTMRVHQEPDGQITQAIKGDSRITPLGAFLRCTSLDELPQFYNVLQGRMSIVGPRPHAIKHNELYMDQIDSYMQRHCVKPGITGWAQINGFRGETDTLEKMKQRVEYDLFYIENWSLWLDLKIIFLTILKGFVNENAY